MTGHRQLLGATQFASKLHQARHHLAGPVACARASTVAEAAAAAVEAPPCITSTQPVTATLAFTVTEDDGRCNATVSGYIQKNNYNTYCYN